MSRVWYSDPENIGEEERISEVQYLYEDEYLLGPTTTRTKYADDTYAETKASYDPKYGGVITSTDAKGNTTTYTYDAMGRPYEIYYPAYNSSTGNKYVKEQFSYSKQGEFNNTYYFKLGKYIYDSGDSSSFDSILSTEICMYDDYGNLVYRQTDAGEEEYIYDNYNRAVKYKNYNDFGTDNISASCAYDMLNRIVSSTDAFGNSIYAVYKLLSNEYYFIPAGTTTKENHSKEYYDMYGNLIKTEVYPNGKTSAPITSTFTYDLAGNVLTSTDGNGNTVSFEYDSLGNNIKTVRPDGSIVENQFTKWGTSTKTTVIDGENRYSSNSDYGDDRGLATSIYSTGLDINTKPWYNEYDVNGSLLKTTAPNANTINYLYDNSGNLTQSVNGSQRNTFTYAFDGQLATQSKYVNDILVETATYNYDSLEHLSSKVIGSDTTSYTYNTMGSVTSVTSPTGFTTAYTLDKAERVTGVGFDGKEITYEYYGDGMVKKITYPNSMTTEYSYDNANRVTDIVTTLGSTVLQSYSYTYDGNGNVLTVSGSENVTYTYDSLNRLASSTKNGVKTTYGYDSRNNLVSETDGTNTKTYEYGGDNRLHKVTENGVETIYEYDLNGNLIQRGEDLFAYDENNRLVYSKVDGVETMYEIGVEGLRSSKTTNGVTTTYKLNENGYVLVENEDDIIYGNTALAKKSDTNYYYYLYNAHGDVTAIVDEAGNVVNTYEYDPWGEIISQEETVSNSLKYAGEYYDEETGLIYLRNRYYEPSARRFATEDPARDDLNWYCYCSNNPIVFVDPSGLDAIIITADHAAGGAGHTSALYQNVNGEWFYTYWGNKAAAVIRIPDSYIKEYRRNGDVLANSMKSLGDFNNALSKVLSENGLKNITKNYTHATYVVGDFTESLQTAYADVSSAYTNKHSNGTLTILDDGSKVFQGHNSPYNVGYRNCLDKTYASLSKGKLADGTNVGKYMNDLGFEGGMIPKLATSKFSDIFMNNFFTYKEAYNLLNTYANLYSNGNHLTRNKRKGSYATAVISK